ncbi:MAG: alpha-amylase family glycosyl hydrolase [Aeromonadaceae bacterium]
MSPVQPAPRPAGLPADWAKGAVFMEIYVRGYQDSNGDGIGDFNGLTSRLDYLAKLGIQGIWLMPINASQDHDHGYAVTDYRKLEPDYGNEADFKAFLDAAHARGIGVIMDYVINHSAYQNPLFLDSKNKLNGKREWYIWRDHDPGWVNWDQSSTWHRIRPSRDFYYGVFWEQMPDFNLKNPEVLAYHHDNLRYWLNMGVDGFRFDAVGQLIENGKNAYESQPENKAILHELQQLVTQSYSDRFMICEEPSDPITAASKEACGSAFAFGFNEALRDSVKGGAVTPELQQQLTTYPLDQMGLVLGTHDSYVGERLIEDFKGDLSRYKLAAATQLTLPGQPFIYYGEEIGMGHSEGNLGDWGLRAPMSWDSQGGFSSAPPFRAPASNQAQYNAASQQASPDSLWHFYQHWIALRKAHPALRQGDLQLLSSDKVLAFTRSTQNERLLVVINYSPEPQEIALPLKGKPHAQAIEGQGKPLTCSTKTHCKLAIQGSAIQLYRLP